MFSLLQKFLNRAMFACQPSIMLETLLSLAVIVQFSLVIFWCSHSAEKHSWLIWITEECFHVLDHVIYEEVYQHFLEMQKKKTSSKDSHHDWRTQNQLQSESNQMTRNLIELWTYFQNTFSKMNSENQNNRNKNLCVLL